MSTLTTLKRELDRLLRVELAPEVAAAVRQVRLARAGRVAEVRAEIEALRAARPPKPPRWPIDTPTDVLDLCDKFWRGSSEHHEYRIHCWNERAVWTSYPSGGYSDNGGYHPTPASYRLVSRRRLDHHGKAIELDELESTRERRVTPAIMRKALDTSSG